MKKKNLYILVAILIIVLIGGYFVNRKYYKNPASAISPSPVLSSSPSPAATVSSEPTSTPSPPSEEIPSSYLIKNFPFQSQAPFANWDKLHDEACEEAAVILVQYWQKGKSLSAETMDDEILKMVDWEINNWGLHKDLTIKETAEMAKEFYGLNLTPKYGITIDDIKKQIAQDNPVIIPTAGRLLGNPYFRSPGPVYHMLVVIGYEGNNIVVQDIGTRRGDHYKYNKEVLYNAIHDWNGTEESINNGRKAMLVF